MLEFHGFEKVKLLGDPRGLATASTWAPLLEYGTGEAALAYPTASGTFAASLPICCMFMHKWVLVVSGYAVVGAAGDGRNGCFFV